MGNAAKSEKRDNPVALVPDQTIDELLCLAGVSPANTSARSWITDALLAARAFAAADPLPLPAKHNAPLDRIIRDTDRLVASLKGLRGHLYAHRDFWRYAAFGPVHNDKFERAGVMPTLKNIRQAASSARVSKTGRPKAVRKQHIIDLALAFCARFSATRPSSDANNFFSLFAERFFEHSTGFSVEDEGFGIDRQLKLAMRRLPIHLERAAHLNEIRC